MLGSEDDVSTDPDADKDLEDDVVGLEGENEVKTDVLRGCAFGGEAGHQSQWEGERLGGYHRDDQGAGWVSRPAVR